jgi:ankyrin repeat protein
VFVKSLTFCSTVLLVLLCSISFAQDGSKLIEAVMYQDLDAVKKTISQGIDINYQDPTSGSTALILAANYNFGDIAKFLIENGADIDLQAKNGTSPLMAAAGSSEEIVKLLIEKGADVNAKNERGTTAFTASITGILSERVTTAVPKLLLEKGANVDEAPQKGRAEGYTVLMMAARNQHPDLVQFLIDHGANINAEAKDGSTPLSLAKKEEDDAMIELLQKLGAKK